MGCTQSRLENSLDQQVANAIITGNLETLRLIARNTQICSLVWNNWYPLPHATILGKYDIVEYLLQQADIDINITKSGMTSLFLAVSKGYVHIVELLLEQGADFNIPYDKVTPLTEAAKRGHTNILRLLHASGASVDGITDTMNPQGEGPLFWAVSRRDEPMTTLLLELGAKVNEITNEGTTALIMAASGGLERVTRLLLEYGADPDILNKEGKTADTLAEENGYIGLSMTIKSYRKTAMPQGVQCRCPVDMVRLQTLKYRQSTGQTLRQADIDLLKANE
jgi:ankyrin repeat protein